MYGAVITEATSPDADFGTFFLHNEGYSTMCGHAIIAISTLAIEMKWNEVQEGENILKIDINGVDYSLICIKILSQLNQEEMCYAY